MNRKLWIVAALILLAAALWGGTTQAEVSGSCGDSVTWTLSDAGKLTISGTGPMYNYETEEAPWYSERDSVKTVTIQDGVTTIGSGAFRRCIYMTGITIPNSVTKICGQAFYNCGLQSVSIPSSVTAIEPLAFAKSRLTSVNIPGTVLTVGDSAFADCDSLQSETMNWGTTTVGDLVFSDCYNLRTASLPHSVVSLGEGIYKGCKAWAGGQYNLIVVNTSVTGDVLYGGKDKTITTFIIPDNVVGISGYSFQNFTKLTEVEIPENVKRIGAQAFSNCAALTDVTILNDEAEIVDNAFTGCIVLTLHGRAGSSAQAYAQAAGIPFELVRDPARLRLPSDLTAIGEGAFANTAAEEVVIPKTVAAITGNPFAGSGVRTIYGYAGSAAQTLAESYPDQFTFVGIDDAWMASH